MIKLAFGQREVRISKVKAGVLIGVVWVVILTAAVLLVYFAIDSNKRARDRLSDQATRYAHLIAHHHRFGFAVADVLLRDVFEYLTWEDFNGTMSADRREQVLGYLTRHRDRLPGIASFTIVGADGIRRIGVVGKDFTNLSDRGYYKALRDGREFFISNVEDGRASGKPGIHVARRYAAPDGTFGGLVVINLSAEDLFVSFYKTLNLGRSYATTLRDDTRILLTYPKYTLSAAPLKERDLIGARLAEGQDSGVLVAVDPADGIEKLTAFSRLEGSGLFATTSLPVGDEIAEARLLTVGALLSALACILGAAGATFAISKARALAAARDEAVRASAERKRLIRMLNTAVEDERKSISVEIHDVINAMLLQVRLEADAIVGLVPEAGTGTAVKAMGDHARLISRHASDLYTQCRRIVRRLRPEILDVLGLDQSIDEMVTSYNDKHLTCRFSYSSDGDIEKLDPNVSIAAYRLVQEALSNVMKHAEATQVAVSLRLNQAANTLDIRIVDDGVGFDPTAVTPGIGVLGMRERVAALNGALKIQSSVESGTEIVATIPLEPALADQAQ
jgi:signal transduction histidine kinase